jgi:polysaccharide export outer membrane protein
VTGAVGSPGVYQVVGGKTLFNVLLEAGGVNADAREIIILRPGPTGTERIKIDAAKLLVEGDLSVDVGLRAGDIVMVPEATQFKVFVNGAVSQQGPVEFSAGEPLTLLQAISAAGGVSERAKLDKVKILRRLPDGSPQSVVVNMKRVRKGLDPDVVLQANDIIVVGERFF